MIYAVLEGNVWTQVHVGTEAWRHKEQFEQVEDESARTGGGEREAGYKGVLPPRRYDPTYFNSLVVLHAPPTGSYRTYINVGTYLLPHARYSPLGGKAGDGLRRELTKDGRSMQRTVHNLPGSARARWILIITPIYVAVNLAIAIKEDSSTANSTAYIMCLLQVRLVLDAARVKSQKSSVYVALVD